MSSEVTHTKKKMLKATWNLETSEKLNEAILNSYTANLEKRTGLSKVFYYIRNIRNLNREQAYYKDVFGKLADSIRDEVDNQIMDELFKTLGEEDRRVGI